MSVSDEISVLYFPGSITLEMDHFKRTWMIKLQCDIVRVLSALWYFYDYRFSQNCLVFVRFTKAYSVLLSGHSSNKSGVIGSIGPSVSEAATIPHSV